MVSGVFRRSTTICAIGLGGVSFTESSSLGGTKPKPRPKISPPVIYLCYLQALPSAEWGSLYVRTKEDPEALAMTNRS